MGNREVFLALVRAGLWEKVNENLNENLFRGLDWGAVQKLAEEQSVVGLVAAGFEKLTVYGLPLTEKLKLIGKCQLVEEQNKAMNLAMLSLVNKLREVGIDFLLVKGQGVAQCYARPLWRFSGDIDLFFSKDEFPKAVKLLTPFATEKVQEALYTKSYGLIIDGCFVELHGTLRNSLSSRMDKVIDEVQEDTFHNRRVRTWVCGDTKILMPDANNDLFLLFTHFVRHFYKGGFSLRQLCDWCRLMWTYREEIDANLLEKRLHKAELLNEWKTFAALVVNDLGMPVEAMPLYEDDVRWRKKGAKILDFILKGKKLNKVRDTVAIAKISPWKTICFLPSIFFNINRMKIKERIIH